MHSRPDPALVLWTRSLAHIVCTELERVGELPPPERPFETTATTMQSADRAA
jgi:hypothetical protein